MVVGAIGVALGALLGYLLPATEVQERLLGEEQPPVVQRASATLGSSEDEERSTERSPVVAKADLVLR